MTTMEKCEECGQKFKRIGTHYSMKPDHRPTLSERQHEIITGLLLGDGWVSREHKGNPRFAVDMINRKFIEWLDTQFKEHTLGSRLQKTGKDHADTCGHNPENTNDVWRFKTRTNPELEQYRDWYSSGEKQYPEELELTPTILKMWYVSDGSYHLPERNVTPTLSFGCANEADNNAFISELFSEIGADITWTDKVFRISIEDAEKVWNYMGSPPPGFDYKWP